MKAMLHTVRDTASFCAWCYLVPLALCALAIVTVAVAQALVAATSDARAMVEVPVAAPAKVDAHGAPTGLDKRAKDHAAVRTNPS
jgi:hypothetical protein